jgi:hypothetical protein
MGEAGPICITPSYIRTFHRSAACPCASVRGSSVSSVVSGSAETWLIGLAQDILHHEACFGCKYNAATALEELGVLHQVLVLQP